ncbi:biological adhesion protein [Trichomonas vaginalis G3]|uniref:biological adhesion protein n=1 Tax=Trichomonas vaginalis (strain ATCC PRA-98 / G3) TaxID=412133 RepID=UPI0021E600B5|nr:biological adhesion protein [Trichomonas vaginalis G3]KAI5513431.1 biological adhesion protein [Trichomonas vaginalis G3]
MSDQESFGDLSFPTSPNKSGATADSEASAKQQLQKVYKILSTSFSREVQSVSDVQAVIKAFVTKYLKTKDQLKEATEMNDELTSRLQQSFDQTQLDEANQEQLMQTGEELNKKLRQYKKRVLALEDQLREQQTANEEAQTQIRELKQAQDDLKREKTKLTEDLTKAQLAAIQNQPVVQETDPVEKTAKLFEELVAAQASEIEDLVHQRDILIENIRSLDGAVLDAEKMLTEYANEKAESEKMKSELIKKNEALTDKLPTLAQEVEQRIPCDLRSSLPQNGSDSEKFILATIEALVQTRAVPQQPVVEEKEETVAKNKYIALLTRLEDAVRFIQSIAKAGDKAGDICPLGIDSEVRTQLLTQAARMGHFVDENLLAVGIENLPNHMSIFEPGSFESTEAQLKEFYNFVTEEQLKESPVRELFALFASVCEVNKMVMNFAENQRNKSHQTDRNVVNSEALRNLQRDNFDLAQWKAVNQEKIEAATAVLAKLTEDDGETAMDVMANKLAQKYEDAAKENKELKETIEKLENEKKEMEESNQVSMQEATEQIQTRDISLQEAEKSRLEETQQLNEKVSQLSQQNQSLAQRFKATTEGLEAALREKTAKLKKALLAQTETKKMLDQIQERTNAIVSENETLHQQNAEMEETLTIQKEQLDALAENEKKLRDSREALKKRIANYEQQNSTTLQDLKTRNDAVQQKYQDTITNLEKEIQDLKAATEQLKEENESGKKERQELQQTITNLRVSERSLNLKLKTLQERQALEKSAAEARNNTYMISLKAQAGRQIDEAKAQLEQTRQAITKILQNQFGEQLEEDASFNDLFNRLDRRLQMYTSDKRILADAIKLRGDLKLAANVTLSEAWASEVQSKNNAETAVARITKERRIIENELTNLKRSTEKMSQDAKQAAEWENWGRSLFKQVNESSAEIPVQELRFKLSEDVLAAIKDRSTLKRLDTLRQQKKVLKNPALQEPIKTNQELSIRSIMCILIFAQRINGGPGNLTPISISPRKD